MTEYEAMLARHSVRQYKNQPIDAETVATLQRAVNEANAASGLHIQLVTEEPEAFNSGLAHYGRFRGVRNYFAVCGPKGREAQELAGYYGERLVLLAQALGLNTCWVALTFSKRKAQFELAEGEKLIIMIALGYGENQGNEHKSKGVEQVAATQGEVPQWFADGIAAALTAPTAVNQQKFRFELLGQDDSATGKPLVRATAPRGNQTSTDLGIAKYHFELGAGKDSFAWA